MSIIKTLEGGSLAIEIRLSFLCIDAVASSMTNGIKVMSFVAFFILSLDKIMNGKMDMAMFIAMISYFSFIFLPINSLKEFCSNIYKFKMLIKKIGKSLNPTLKMKLPEHEKLSFISCTYSHDEKKQDKQLDDFSIDIDSKIGIVGVSGEGKSTLIKVILGELIPDEGKCVFGDELTFNISKYFIYSSIRYYSQDTEIFDNDLQFNLTLGKKEVSRSEYFKIEKQYRQMLENIYEVFANSNKNKKIELNSEEQAILKEIFLINSKQLRDKKIMNLIFLNLPQNKNWFVDYCAQLLTAKHYYIKEKYDKLVEDLELSKLNGRNFGQRGANISGGEKNKVAIARFLLPEYGNFFVLDEPFTSLDALTEKKCIDVIEKYMRNMKGIIISHKMDLISQISDVICVMENGKISQKGNHATLMNQDGLYRKLWMKYTEKISEKNK